MVSVELLLLGMACQSADTSSPSLPYQTVSPKNQVARAYSLFFNVHSVLRIWSYAMVSIT